MFVESSDGAILIVIYLLKRRDISARTENAYV